MICSNCGFENRLGRKFCGRCGTPLAKVCPACGGANEPDVVFCGECGSPLSAGSPVPPSAAAPRVAATPPSSPAITERRLVSVLFADLVGFTTLSEARDSEEVRDLLSRYFETCQAVIARYGGVVEKFIGDAVMAVWGTPVANEDDAERAVRTALDLVEAVTALGAEVGAPGLSARAGVLTGEATVNLGADGQGMVAGDLVNTASRIQSVAEPGTVLVGEATFHAARGAVAFKHAGELTLKGKTEPVPAWRALRVIAQRKGVGRTQGVEPPFVGREEELRQIKDSLHATARERRARLVSVTGVPGIGKSRLALEFLNYVDGLAETIYWHQGRSPAYGEGITFWALGEMVRMRARIAESDDATSSSAKLSAAVDRFVPDPEDRRWVEPRLAHLLGLAEAPQGEREELFSAWRTFFERIADLGPVVMVFEDLQWADAGLIDFVESILEWSRSHPIMVLTLARPELLDRWPTWGAGQRSFTSIHLEPLSDAAMRALLAGLVSDLAADITERILSRAEGVPLYAVETVRMLADRGVLVARGGVYQVAGELGDLSIPDSLHALIASRLDTLEPGERSVLQDAAVLGTSFTLDGLAALTGTDATVLETLLRDLVRKEMLVLDADPRSPERGQYGFVQSLIREVAYGTLARADRRAKHLAAAHHLEALGDEELAGVVAAHYVEAYRASPAGPEAEAVAARARDWLSQAGERALSLGSPEQALSFFEQTLEVTAEGPERAVLLERAGEAASRAGSYERAIAVLEEVIAYYHAMADPTAAGLATARLARAIGLGLRRFSEAIERAESALASIGPDGDPRARADLAAGVAHAYGLSGSGERALEWAERALPLAEALDDQELLLRAVGAKASALFNLGRHREAVMLARGAVALSRAGGDLLAQAGALHRLGVFLLDDDPQEALGAALDAGRVSRQVGDRHQEINSLLNAAECAIWLGEWERAREALHEVDEREPPGDTRDFLAICHAMLAGLTGDLADAAARLGPLERRAETTEFLAHRTTFLSARAFVGLALGDLEAAYRAAADAVAADPSGINSPNALAVQARAALWLGDASRARSALAGMEAFRGRWMRAERETVQAGIAALEGRAEQGIAAYARAMEAWRALDAPLDLALCGLDAGTLLRAGEPGVTNAVEEARGIFERLGARPFLERLDREARIENAHA